MHLRYLLLGMLMLVLVLPGNVVKAQYVIPATPTSNSIFQDFNSLPSTNGATTGTWTDLVTIPFWYFQRTPVTPGTPPYTFSVIGDDGNSNIGNAYSYGINNSTDRALGSVGSNNAASGHYAWGIQFQNTTGSVVSDFKVSYRGEQWRDGGVSSVQIVKFYYKTSATAITNLQPSISAGWTSVPALNFTCKSNIGTGTGIALNGNLPAYSSVLSSPLSALTLPNNQYVMLKWDDPKYSGTTDHGMATDSVTISWTVCATPTTPASNIGGTGNLNSIDLSWTNGDGAGRYVVINTVNTFTNPVDGVAFTAPNPVYSGTGEQVVYAGTGNTVTVTNLDPCRDYYFRVFEYNCTAANSKYNTATGANNPNLVATSSSNLPVIYNVSGNTEYCSNDPGVNILLSNSQVGVNYQLYLNGTAVGTPVAGTGSPITLTNTLTAGVYTVVGTYGSYTYCVSNMNGSVTVTIYPVPVAPTGATVDRNHICADDNGNITLTSVGGSGTNHEWYTGTCGSAVIDTNAVITIPSPTVTTTYFVSWTTVDCGTTPCQSVTVTVDNPPTPASAGLDQSLCGTLTTTLTANAPASGNGNWTYYTGPGTTGTLSFNPGLTTYNAIITASDTGTYNLIWTIANGVVCSPSADTVTIKFSNALTVSPSSNSPVCSGDDLYLYCDIASSTYSWTGPNGFTSAVKDPVITNCSTLAGGTYTVTVSNIPGGCPTTTNTTTVVVNQSAQAAGSAASSPASVCAGSAGNLVLSVPLGAGDTLHWYEGSCGGIHLGTGNNLSIPYPAITTKYFAQWASNLCGNAPCDSITVQVISPPTPATANSQSLCGVTSTVLDGNNPTVGTGTWTVVSGPGTGTFSNPNAYNSNFSASAMGIYTLRWTISNGATCPVSFADITIEFSNSITVVAGSNSPACEADTIFLTSSIAGATYSWTGPNGFTSTLKDPFITGVSAANAGIYSVTVTNIPGGCPPTTNTVNVAVTNKPATPAISSVNISAGQQDVCQGDVQTYSVTPPSAGSTYSWVLAGGGTLTTAPGSNQSSITWTTVGGPYQLSVTETTSGGCLGNPVLLNITVNAPPTISLLDTTGATNGQANGSVVVTSVGATQYSLDGIVWTNSPTFGNLLAGNYTMYVKNSLGCVGSEPFTINDIIVGLTLDADTVADCPGKTVDLSVYATGMVNFKKFNLCLTYDPGIVDFYGISNVNDSLDYVQTISIPAGQLQVTWNGTSGKTIADGELLFKLSFHGKISGLSPLLWSDLISDTCGIFDVTDMPYVISWLPGAANFLQTPVSTITGETQLCLGEPLDLFALGDTLTHTWTLPDGTLFNGQEYSIGSVALSDTGSYRLLTTNTIGCINKDTVDVQVHLLPKPALACGDTCCVESFNNLAAGTYAAYLWSDGSIAPSISISHEGEYWVKVTDDFGCEGYDTVALIKCPTEIWAPTAFSPNGDGFNDRFRAIYSDQDVLEDYKMLIYDRWGQLVFESSDILQSWDGYYKGKMCPVGAYTYIISFRKPEGKSLVQKIPFRGMVTLIR